MTSAIPDVNPPQSIMNVNEKGLGYFFINGSTIVFLFSPNVKKILVLTLNSIGKGITAVAFFSCIVYTKVDIGGVGMNEFEKNVQSKRNDAVDSGVGFVVSFLFFTLMFVVATAIQLIGS